MREKFAHWNVLFMQYLKRDWKLLIVWVLGLGGFSGGFVPLFVEMSKEQGLAGMYEIMQNPAMTAMIGPMAVKEMSDYTIGAMYSNMMLLFCGLFAMILAAMHIVVHTRREEELGLTEFVCAYRVGRQANSLALLVEMILVQAVLALFTGGLMMAFGEESIAGGAVFLFGASIGVAGMLGTVFALLMAQLMPTATSTLGTTMGLIGLLYLLRAGTDISNVELSMLNPMGWTYLTYPFAENRVFPLVIGGVFCLILAAVSMMLEGARDMPKP